MTKHIFKAAVIGCGNIGAAIKRYGKNVQPATHAGAYQHNRRTRLVALVDVDKEKLARIAARLEAGKDFLKIVASQSHNVLEMKVKVLKLRFLL